MQFSIVALVASAACVTAQALLFCGHELVNYRGYSQKDIAQATCNRSDTCQGREWNTVIEIVRMSSGPAEWSELHSTGRFCSNGCYDGGKCH